MVGTLVRECKCASSWCDLDLTFDLAVVTLTFNVLSGLCLGNCNMQEVDSCWGHWLSVHHHGVTLI